MTRTTNARLAGFLFLLYIAASWVSTTVYSNATSGEGIAAKLEGIARSAAQFQVAILLALLCILIAWALAVALYAITRDEDRELALVAMTCRFGEGALASIYVLAMLGLLWLAQGATGADAPDIPSAHALAALFVKAWGWGFLLAAAVFAVGSTLFAYLFLRARSIPVPLAWLGIFASLLLVAGLPARLVNWVPASMGLYMWLPMLVFEVILGAWLIVKGVRAPVSGV